MRNAFGVPAGVVAADQVGVIGRPGGRREATIPGPLVAGRGLRGAVLNQRGAGDHDAVLDDVAFAVADPVAVADQAGAQLGGLLAGGLEQSTVSRPGRNPGTP